jgi:hypothetical protein
MIIKKFNHFIINENLKSYPYTDIFKYLKKLGLKEHVDYYNMYDSYKIYLAIRPKYKKIYKELISKLENFYGWYLAFVVDHNNINQKNVDFYKNNIKTYIENYMEDYIEDYIDDDYAIGRLCFEPKYDKILDYIEIPDKIYHITNGKFYFKIMKKGLIPKHLDRISYHPDRIFFGKSEDVCLQLYNHSEFKINQPIILTIDAKGLIKKGINFYLDSNLTEGGIYVIDNVPPKYIIGMKKLEDYD